jgi:hypothetical protein
MICLLIYPALLFLLRSATCPLTGEVEYTVWRDEASGAYVDESHPKVGGREGWRPVLRKCMHV